MANRFCIIVSPLPRPDPVSGLGGVAIDDGEDRGLRRYITSSENRLNYSVAKRDGPCSLGPEV